MKTQNIITRPFLQFDTGNLAGRNLSDAVKSISIQKSRKVPAGTFNIVMKQNHQIGTNHFYSSMAGKNDVVKVGFNSRTFMLGLVDKKAKNKETSENALNYSDVISGRDFGKLFLDEQAYIPLSYPANIDEFLPANHPLVQYKEVAFKLIGEDEKAGFSFLSAPIASKFDSDGNITEMGAIDWIVTRMPSTYITAGERNSEQFKKYLATYVRQFSGDKVSNFTLSTFNGTLWELLQSCVDSFYEVFVTTESEPEAEYTPLAVLNVKPKPFDRDGDNLNGGEIEHRLTWDSLITESDYNTHIHQIPMAAVTDYKLSSNDEEIFSIFQVNDVNSVSALAENSGGITPGRLFAVWEPELIKKYGVRPMTAQSSLVPLNAEGNLSAEKLTQVKTARLYNWFNYDNYYSGTIGLKGIWRINIGDALYIPDYLTDTGQSGMYFYIDTVDHAYDAVDNPTGTTALGVSRGHNPTDVADVVRNPIYTNSEKTVNA